MKIIHEIARNRYTPIAFVITLLLCGGLAQASEKCSPGGGRREECTQLISK
ncbi:hypothetical protein NIES4106_61970 (plasmid) [Fischerella sp. NIES-4106]|nr:hypothetical protein NIES4106_61970 [Fischerella sp. NIES-4106]